MDLKVVEKMIIEIVIPLLCLLVGFTIADSMTVQIEAKEIIKTSIQVMTALASVMFLIYTFRSQHMERKFESYFKENTEFKRYIKISAFDECHKKFLRSFGLTDLNKKDFVNTIKILHSIVKKNEEEINSLIATGRGYESNFEKVNELIDGKEKIEKAIFNLFRMKVIADDLRNMDTLFPFEIEKLWFSVAISLFLFFLTSGSNDIFNNGVAMTLILYIFFLVLQITPFLYSLKAYNYKSTKKVINSLLDSAQE